MLRLRNRRYNQQNENNSVHRLAELFFASEKSASNYACFDNNAGVFLEKYMYSCTLYSPLKGIAIAVELMFHKTQVCNARRMPASVTGNATIH